MTDQGPPTDDTDAPRRNRRRRRGPRDPARVAETTDASPLPPGSESSYGPAAPGPPPTAARPIPDRNRAIAPRLTAPEFVAITDKQYQQAVDLLAAMIVSWAQREDTDPADTP